MIPIGTAQPILVTPLDGVRFAIGIRSHEIIVDQTLRGGGQDSAPTPLELLGASLGSCIAYYVGQFLTVRQLSAEGLRVEVVTTKAAAPSRIENFAVKIVLPADFPDRYRPMIDRILETCPAHNTLAMGAAIGLTVEAPASSLVGI